MLILLIFVVLAIGLFAFLSSLDQRTQQGRILRQRLTAVDAALDRNPDSENAVLRDELLSSVPALDRILSRSSVVRRLQSLLSQADVKMRAGKFVLVAACIGAGLALLANLIVPGLLAFFALAAGCTIPFLYLTVLRSRRFAKFEELFPQAIDLLARSVRAGHSFAVALETIAEEISEPVAGEFRQVHEEQKFGLPTRDALLNLADRVPLIDVQFFVVSVVLQRETGGNLAEILDKLSYTIRERFKILRQVRVYTAQGRMSTMILTALPFLLGFVMAFLSPQFIRVLFTDPMGHVLIALGLLMLGTGYFLLQKIVRVRV